MHMHTCANTQAATHGLSPVPSPQSITNGSRAAQSAATRQPPKPGALPLLQQLPSPVSRVHSQGLSTHLHGLTKVAWSGAGCSYRIL